jgi:hypothetical protein
MWGIGHVDNSVFLLKTISDVLTAGGAITAFSLLIYVITFKLKDIVTRSYTYLLACIVLILGTDAFFTTTTQPIDLIFLLRMQYIGLILLPSAYFYFSNALLTITGKPSAGKRTIFGVATLIISALFIYLNFTGKLFLSIAINNSPVPNIERTRMFDVFSIYFVFVMGAVWYNFIRALNRTASHRSKRRMFYLVIAAFGPALGSFPYLLYGSQIIWTFPSIFWMISIIAYFVISISVVVMTYTVSFFGLPWPDRVIKSRLFKWLMRGPITAILTLGVTTLISRLGAQLNVNISSIQILGMVATIVVFEFSITIFAPYWERLLFSGVEKAELEKIRQLENRLLTKNDLQQFLELIVASFCDLLQVKNAALFSLNQNDESPLVKIGFGSNEPNFDIHELIDSIPDKKPIPDYYSTQGDQVFPIVQQVGDHQETVGFIYFSSFKNDDFDEETLDRIKTLINRAATALYDRQQQEAILDSLDVFTPQLTAIQSLLAASRFNQTKIIDSDLIPESEKFEKYIKDALSHFFGGPQLSQNPLVQLRVVQQRISKNGEPAISALRAVMHDAIDRLKPNGDRQYTNEWLLFNILDLKFIQGWKVRDLCRKLAVSEADFYRKQRIAIKAVGDQISLMEQEA